MSCYQRIEGQIRRYGRLAIGIAASAIVISGLALCGAAQAATSLPSHAQAATARSAAAPDLEYSCFGTPHKLHSRYCYFQTQHGRAPLYYPDGKLRELLPLNDKVDVNCYYYNGNTVEDHVSWTQATNNFNGHIPDYYINEGGHSPWDAPGELPQCG